MHRLALHMNVHYAQARLINERLALYISVHYAQARLIYERSLCTGSPGRSLVAYEMKYQNLRRRPVCLSVVPHRQTK